jgi:hypothetical protein
MSEVTILQDEGGLVFATVKSKSHPEDLPHNLFYSREANVGSCDCLGFWVHRHCRHMTLLLAYVNDVSSHKS